MVNNSCPQIISMLYNVMQNIWLKPVVWNDITRNEYGICDWNVKAVCRLGSLKAVARQLSVYEAF
jgi:hypothetical protein